MWVRSEVEDQKERRLAALRESYVCSQYRTVSGRRIALKNRKEDPMVAVGKAAPSFALIDSDGQQVELEDFRGKKVVLWFYPKDDTPG